jgi:hypothetical protein
VLGAKRSRVAMIPNFAPTIALHYLMPHQSNEVRRNVVLKNKTSCDKHDILNVFYFTGGVSISSCSTRFHSAAISSILQAIASLDRNIGKPFEFLKLES